MRNPYPYYWMPLECVFAKMRTPLNFVFANHLSRLMSFQRNFKQKIYLDDWCRHLIHDYYYYYSYYYYVCYPWAVIMAMPSTATTTETTTTTKWYMPVLLCHRPPRASDWVRRTGGIRSKCTSCHTSGSCLPHNFVFHETTESITDPIKITAIARAVVVAIAVAVVASSFINTTTTVTLVGHDGSR
jgi:hypothetical protein